MKINSILSVPAYELRVGGPQSSQWIMVLLGLMCLLAPGAAMAQAQRGSPLPDPLHQLNDSIESLVQKVSPSVVQILVTGYGATEDGDHGQTADVIGRRQAVGSG